MSLKSYKDRSDIIKAKNLLYLLGWLVYVSLAIWLYLHWVRVVDPFPEPEGLGRVYWPVLEYLRASLEIGNDYFFLTPRSYYRLPYPEGSAIFAWLIAAFGGQNMVLQNPWLFNIILIIPLCLAPFFLKNRSFDFWVLAIALYFFPFSQICFKQFSLNAHSVIFAFLALLFFRSWLARKKDYYLFFFWLFMTQALASKHLGVLYLANLVIVYVLWDYYIHKTINIKALIAFFASFLCAMPFYGLLALNFYPAQQVVGHNQSLSFPLFACAAVVIPIFYCGLALAFSHVSTVKRALKISQQGFLLFALCFLCVLQLLVNPQSFGAIIPILIIGAVAMALFGYYCQLNSTRAFIHLFILSGYMNMALIFASNVGRVSTVFFLPLLLLLFQTYVETRSKPLRVLIALVFILFSNFTPSLEKAGYYLGGAGYNLYFVMYNTLHNQLGWQNCPLAATNRLMHTEMAKREFVENPLFLVETFEPWLSQQLEIYGNNLVLHAPMLRSLPFQLYERWPIAKEVIQAWYEQGDEYIFQLQEKGALPVLLRPQAKIMPSAIDIYRNIEISVFRQREPEYFTYLCQNKGALAWLFNRHIFNCLEASGRLESDYDAFPVDNGEVFAIFYIQKNLPLRQGNLNAPNAALQKLIEEYRLKTSGWR